MVEKSDVAAVLELIRPSLQADGGDVQLVDVSDDGVVTVELQGACKGCPMSQMTLANGVERILKERVPALPPWCRPNRRQRVRKCVRLFGARFFTREAGVWKDAGAVAGAMTRCRGAVPHNVPGEPCPADCHYAACHRPTHVVCEDFGVLLNPNRDYDAAVKQVCRFREHFLVNGPDIDPETCTRDKFSGRNRFLL